MNNPKQDGPPKVREEALTGERLQTQEVAESSGLEEAEFTVDKATGVLTGLRIGTRASTKNFTFQDKDMGPIRVINRKVTYTLTESDCYVILTYELQSKNTKTFKKWSGRTEGLRQEVIPQDSQHGNLPHSRTFVNRDWDCTQHSRHNEEQGGIPRDVFPLIKNCRIVSNIEYYDC